MLNDFFKLNTPYTTFTTQLELTNLLNISADVQNILYEPSLLEPSGHPTLKIRGTKFTNVSFSKTKIKEVVFINCKFEDCLFIGSEFLKCEFHNTSFKNCNTYKIAINDTYVNPKSFTRCLKGVDKSNIAVQLFQQLLNNSDDRLQSIFTRTAAYHFKKWQDKLTWNKYWNEKPYKISFWQFIGSYPSSRLYRLVFGYGLRLRNFAASFALVFISFLFINSRNWKSYGLEKKDVQIKSFTPDSSNCYSNLFYTLDATTKLVDSQFQATSDSGMLWLTTQNVFGFILLSGLITIILNRFVK